MDKIKGFLSEVSKNVWFGVKTSFLASRKYFLLKCLVLASTTFLPLACIWLWKEILNGITDMGGGADRAAACLVIYLLLRLFIHILQRCDEYINGRYADELHFYIEGVMMEKTSRMDLAFFDSASMGDKVRHARSNFDIMTEVTWLVFDIISEIINLAATFSVICTYRWWIGLASFFILAPFIYYNKRHTEQLLKMEKEQIRDRRREDYYKNVFYDNDIQFEIKLNGLGELFIKRYKEIWGKLYKINKKEDVRHNIFNTGILVLNALGEILVLAFSAFDVVAGRIGIGDLQYNLGMAVRMREQADQLVDDVNHFLVNNKRLNELAEFIAIQPEIEKSGTKQPSSKPRIEFCNVSFRYPNCGQYVLKNCSFTIEPGEKVGLIGLNGAGKSTVIKLLFRFYDPEEGCVKLDGADLKEYDIYAVRRTFGVLFQDYVTYCLPLREIIALSDFRQRFDDQKLWKACDISGVSDIIKNWEYGFDSVLGRFYADNGKDLSGGQWQLVGLARAYFKESEYMILDEPSAALDPISEDRIFRQLYQLSKGKSSITISHRLSNTMLADRILVIEDGCIIEQGSHFELLEQNGRYAHLFRLQAGKYV